MSAHTAPMNDEAFEALKPLPRTVSTRYRLLSQEARRARESEKRLREALVRLEVAVSLGTDEDRHAAAFAARAAIAKARGES